MVISDFLKMRLLQQQDIIASETGETRAAAEDDADTLSVKTEHSQA